MCGRYYRKSDKQKIAEVFPLDSIHNAREEAPTRIPFGPPPALEEFSKAVCLPRPEKKLHAYVCDPTRLQIAWRNLLEASAPHEQQRNRVLLVDGVSTAETESRLASLCCAIHPIRILLIVNLHIRFCSFGELVAKDHPADP